MILTLLPDTAPILHSPIEDFVFDGSIDPEPIVRDLMQTMDAHRAFGLAANQVGLKLRVFVMCYEEQRLAMFNPTITQSATEKVLAGEGCLSFPGIALEVQRPNTITVRYQNEQGDHCEIDYSGWPARIAQHEIDHLNGITFAERVSKLKFSMAKKKAAKLAKQRSMA